jgi:hypothetical protein
LAFEVRISGPEFLEEENRTAFLRIEESIRQYAAHSREPIFILRCPLPLSIDHFVLLWPRGAVLANLYSTPGTIHGSLRAEWHVEASQTAQPSSFGFRSRQRTSEVEAMENPYRALQEGIKEFQRIVAPYQIKPAAVALFTSPDATLVLPDPVRINDSFRPMTLSFATARTIVHLPNILQPAGSESVLLSNAELEILVARLNGFAQTHIADFTKPVRTNPQKSNRTGRHIRYPWVIAAIVLAAIVLYYILRSTVVPKAVSQADSSSHIAPSHRSSEMIIELPMETELVVSSQQYQTRAEFDEALARGEGVRFLPSMEHVIAMDSLAFAKGVYGYFRVDNAWRKGKLLQTLEPIDTVTIVKFLDPLP